MVTGVHKIPQTILSCIEYNRIYSLVQPPGSTWHFRFSERRIAEMNMEQDDPSVRSRTSRLQKWKAWNWVWHTVSEELLTKCKRLRRICMMFFSCYSSWDIQSKNWEHLRAPSVFFIRLVQVRYGLICSHAFKVAFCRYYVLYMHFVDLMDSLHLANKLGQELSKQARADLELPPEEMKSIR